MLAVLLCISSTELRLRTHNIRIVCANSLAGIVKKCFWALAIVLMLCGLVYNLRGLIVEYLRYDVSVSVSILQEQQIVFPSVTVCNMSPVKKSAMTSNNNNSNTSRRKRDVDNAVLSSNKRLRSFDNARSNRSVGSSNRSETTSENKGNKAVSSSKRIETDTKRYDNKTVIVPVYNQEKRTVGETPVAKRRKKRSLGLYCTKKIIGNFEYYCSIAPSEIKW